VVTEVGPVQVEMPRDRDGSFEPVIVRKRQRRLDGVDGIVLSLSAKGLTTGEISCGVPIQRRGCDQGRCTPGPSASWLCEPRSTA
jgi:hypothetical protein